MNSIVRLGKLVEDKNSNYLWNKSKKIMTNGIVRKLPIGIQTFEKIREGIMCMWIRRNGCGGWPRWDTVFPKSSASVWKESFAFYFLRLILKEEKRSV